MQSLSPLDQQQFNAERTPAGCDNRAQQFAAARERLRDAVVRAEPLVSVLRPDSEVKVPIEGSDLILLQSALTCCTSVRAARDLVFSGGASLPGVGSSALNKNAKRLIQAIEAVVPFEQLISERSMRLLKSSDTADLKSARIAARAGIALDSWEGDDTASPSTQKRDAVLLAQFERLGRVELTLFVCPPVNFARIADEPNDYFRTSLGGSLLSRQMDRLCALVEGLSQMEVPFSIRAVVGDTDEDEYIWPVIGRPSGLDPAVVAARSDELVRSVERYLSDRFTRIDPTVGIEVASMSGIDRIVKVGEKIEATPDADDTARECERMRELWGDYYSGLPDASDAEIAAMVGEKFSAYARQGAALRERFGAVVLLQTERPAELRSRMLNAELAQRGEELITVWTMPGA